MRRNITVMMMRRERQGGDVDVERENMDLTAHIVITGKILTNHSYYG